MTMLSWTELIFLHSRFIAFMEQLMALGVEPRDQDSAAKFLAALKSELAAEKATQVKAQAEADTLAQAIGDLKKKADGLAAQVPFLDEKVNHLDNKVLDRLTEIHAKELRLERTTKANEALSKLYEPMFPLWVPLDI
jgi:predicted  nucleic acid-binding Zn-ribbon protein